MTFRNLYPSEIQVRPTDTKTKGTATLLLFKDARCDMNILDETVGSENWSKEYYDVKGNLFCKVGIRTDNGIIWKSDCGIESNVDAQKGEASDAFKRACVNWGIGRELYTGPRIRIKCPDSYYFNDKLNMAFYVHNITYEGKEITSITIMDRFNNVVFDWDINNGLKSNKNSLVEGLKAFCGNLKGTVDKNLLLAFYKEYSDKAENWRGKMNYQQLWDGYLQRRS